ncbi:Crp/Fnr family transcriptional regulator [Methylobacterium thuringiense]|uniref:Nitrogen fixation regulation protein FixK n=1 Tax=Methylobacterium thuringiense TaxID=1003091 RepID=A0ABQ4TPP1_9HYPH|nr:Crp/Fnr family transcriptional regulator [Methylobacterium thuringiense]GJE57340.1 Nitrogen fixation regulation protein FixK [Methylobacterium thuringiense]
MQSIYKGKLPLSPPPKLAVISALDGIGTLVGAKFREHQVDKGQDVLRFGEVPEGLHVLIAGHTCRYRMLGDGRRQITAILVPGDLCDLEAGLRGRADYAVGALTRCLVGHLPADPICDAKPLNQELLAALLIRLRRDEAIAREWMVSLGRRSAIESLAHLFCELRTRLADVGLATEDSYELRITQDDLADALGITSVHVNRALKQLREYGLITLKRGILVMSDRPALEKLALFDPSYLQP